MKKIISITIAVLWAGLCPITANAATVNFAAYATNNEGGVKNGSILSIDGVNIYHIAGYGLDTRGGGLSIKGGGVGMLPFSVYYDDVNGGLPAGLGVCRLLAGDAGTNAPGAECLDASDDSIDGDDGINEAIFLQFIDGPIDIRNLSFRKWRPCGYFKF